MGSRTSFPRTGEYNARDPVGLTLTFVEWINLHDVDNLTALMSPDHRLVDGLGVTIQGGDDLRRAWAGYFEMFPDYRIELKDIIAAGETVGIFGTAHGTYARAGRLRAENGWSVPLACRARIRDGMVAEWQVYADNEPVRKIIMNAGHTHPSDRSNQE